MHATIRRAAPLRAPILALAVVLVLSAGLSSCATSFFYDQAVARKAKPFLGESKDLDSTGFSEGMKRAYAWCAATPGESVALRSGDGLRLAARYFPAPVPAAGAASGLGEAAAPRKRIAILAHGYSSEGAAMGGFGRYYRDELG
ncbi:MAG: hypothetical protein JNG85_09535, partial [Spirochaetaceae bacterium]|nr:hypothetical protein [Spirochaetaceae bacterium]